MLDLPQTLQQSFGFDGFRDGQEPTITQLLAGCSSLAIFPTGAGKSLCYQLTAIHLPHLTLVVSPLLALMKDQLEFLARHNVNAASIDSTLTAEQNKTVMADVRSGSLKILMVSVERFKNERFRQFINSVSVSMLVIDEAHCISEWGHNFRPDYLKLPTYRQELNIPLVLLLTATATRQVKEDMAEKFLIAPSCIVQTGFYRENLDLSVVPVLSPEKNGKLLSFIQQQQGCGIVYVTLQQSAEQVAQYLSTHNINAVAYHAGFVYEKRQQIQNDFMADKVQVIVATIAFGMGIDKANIRFVIHYDLPKSIENYSQEIGRAGRDGLAANCITLANLDGLNTVENFVFGDTPEQHSIDYVLDNIKEETNHNRWELQVLALSNASNIKQLPMKTLLVQLELFGILKPLFAYFADFKYKFVTAKDQVLAQFTGERRVFLEAIFSNTKFKKIWGEPDFDALFQHYQCDRGRVVIALEYLHEKQYIELETKRITEVYSINQTELADPSLSQTLHQYFVEKEKKEINRIAALVRFFELEHCLSKNLSLYFDDNHSPERCGHCSVCRGQIAKLEYSTANILPSDEKLIQVLQALNNHMQNKNQGELSLDTFCRFLTGLSIPLFNRNKVKQLAGFGLCSSIRYQEVRDKVASLSLT
jgi:ATP-dependent DNA helicase RecQ